MIRTWIQTALVAFAITAATGAGSAQSKEEDIYEQLDLLMRVLERVRSEYVDEVEDTAVIEAAIQGMLKSLDPHSTYLNHETYEQVKVQMKGEYGGLGIEVQMEDNLVKVVSPIDDTPADRAGIQGGDFISHIDGTSVQGKTLTEAVKEMRGPVGDPITVTILRNGVEAPFDVTIVRDNILVRSVRHRVEDDTIGYIRVTTFNQQTGTGVEEALETLSTDLGDDLDGYILDLRNNPGGLLNEAIRVSDAFLDRGQIVSTRGRRRANNNRWFATPGDLADGMPVVVLVNAYSASASEIVAGALKDHRRAILVGDQTFGKGTVQSEIRLGRKGDRAIRLTTARYFTPSGTSIQERGIEPDFDVLMPRPKNAVARRSPRREADLNNVISNDQRVVDRAGEVDVDAPLIEVDDKGRPTEPVEDLQLQFAIKLLKGLKDLPQAQIAQAGQ